MPRVKLIRHGLDDKGGDHWGFPIYPWGECPHPRGALRFDPRYPTPSWTYCRACGQAGISPYHGMSEEEIAEGRERAVEMGLKLGFAREAHLPQELARGFKISTSEARRHIAQGAVKINDEPITDQDVVLWGADKVQIGDRWLLATRLEEDDPTKWVHSEEEYEKELQEHEARNREE